MFGKPVFASIHFENLNKHPPKIMNMVKIATEFVFIDNAVEF